MPIKYHTKRICFFLLTSLSFHAFSQRVAINSNSATAHANSILDITSTTMGMRMPLMTAAQRGAAGLTTLTTAAQGLMLYQTDGTQGLYLNLSTNTTANWDYIVPVTLPTTTWNTAGNTGTSYPTNFIGTTDATEITFKTNNIRRMRLKADGALYFYDDSRNMCIGDSTGAHLVRNALVSGAQNTFIGWHAGTAATSQLNCTFLGAYAGEYAVTGDNNTYLGTAAGFGNSVSGTASNNTFVGSVVGYKITTGSDNTMVGRSAGFNMVGGSNNVFFGVNSGTNNVSGNYNAFFGFNSGSSTLGSSNTFVGYAAGSNHNGSGDGNTFVGYSAGSPGAASDMGTYNTYFGYNAGVNSTAGITNSTAIGNGANTTLSNSVVIGNTSVSRAGIRISNPTNATCFHINSNSAIIIPVGTTAERPSSPVVGMIRYNSTLAQVETYNGAWGSQVATSTLWGRTGNTGLTNGVHFFGTTEASDLIFKANGTQVMRIDNSTGNMYIGNSTPSSTVKMYINYSNAATGSNLYAHQIQFTQSAPAAYTGKAMETNVTYSGGATQAGVTAVEGNLAFNSGTLTWTKCYGAWGIISSGNATNYRMMDIGGVTVSGGGTITNLYGVKIANPSPAGTITTNYGVLINSITNGTTKYAIYSNGGQSYHAGNFGINQTSPTRALDVNGTARVGVNGTTITNVIKATVAKDLPSINAGASSVQTFAVANAVTTSSVMISPQTALNSKLTIDYARVSAAGTVEVKFKNIGASADDEPNMNWYITLIQ